MASAATAAASLSAASLAGRKRLIDIGANLTDGMFQGLYHGKRYHAADLSQVLQRAYDAGQS